MSSSIVRGTAPVRVAMAGAGSSNSNSKTIGNLNPVPETLRDKIRAMMVPVEFLDSDAGQSYNFRVNLGDLIETISKIELGLDKVDNTADKDKPASDAVILELRKKFGTDNKPSVSDITDLSGELDKFRKLDVDIPIEEIEDLVWLLSQKADVEHSHSFEDLPWLQDVLNNFAPASHSHSLTEMNGWSNFIESLTQSLANFATLESVDERINETALVVGSYDWQ